MNHLLNITLVLTMILILFTLPRASKTIIPVKGGNR